MRRALVTGGNKGIGLAIVKGILAEHDDTFVWLGARDAERGRAALTALTSAEPRWAGRVQVLELDVADDASVQRAAARVVELTGEERPLYGLVNNAGIGGRGLSLAEVLEVNARGLRRVCEVFLRRLDPARGRIVNVTSASGPTFVSRCSADRQRFFLDPATDAQALEALMAECITLEGEAAFASRGLVAGDAYGLSKACANTYTQHLALEHPALQINACTPGFIETDMTRHYAASAGKSPAEMGMKTPDDGARCPLHLLFGVLEGNGRYYGSDAVRSPLDRYRAPGSPPFAGEPSS
jgi:NAD(P)-dependent dehydrogenase (short-subunit alcohol dehydrogenase family)